MKTIRIETNGSPLFKHWRVFLDEVDISKFINALSFSAGVDERVCVNVKLIGHSFELPEEFEALVTAERAE